MKRHTKYYRKFLGLYRYTGLEHRLMHDFIKSMGDGQPERVLGDYVFRLLWARQAGRDTLYSLEVYMIDEKGGRTLVFKSPVLIDPPHKTGRYSHHFA